jgi:endo-1,4-beta-D-glucanase Y
MIIAGYGAYVGITALITYLFFSDVACGGSGGGGDSEATPEPTDTPQPTPTNTPKPQSPAFTEPNSTVYDPRWTPEWIEKSYDEFIQRFIFDNPKGEGFTPRDPSQDYNIYSESFGNSMRLAALGGDENTLSELEIGAEDILQKGNHLFAWLANSNAKVQDSNSAADADLDIAIASEDNPISNSIQANETTTLGDTDILLPSDGDWVWLSPDKVAYNPSYFDPLTMELLGFEDKIIDDGFNILGKAYQAFNHQVPDWCALTADESGEITVEDYNNSHQGFDAVRVWLRIARYALWGQDAQRKAQAVEWCQTLLNDHPNLTVDGYRNQFAVSMELMVALGAGDQNRYLALSSELYDLYDKQTGLFGWPEEQNMIFNQYYAIDAAATTAGFAPEF